MDVVTDLSKIPDGLRRASCALGNFDGVHRGHAAVIGTAVQRARDTHSPAAVIAFEPHPRRFLKPDEPPFRLTSLEVKARLLSEMGLDALFVVPFTKDLASLSAQAFVDDILAETLNIGGLVVGYDFRFGKGRQGDIAFLEQWGQTAGVPVDVVAPVGLEEAGDDPGQVVYSSSKVREALRAGDVALAERLLGHHWMIDGIVQHGDKRGRTIGFPTINLNLGDYLRPALGVYAVSAQILSGPSAGRYGGVANVGRRPTFDDGGVVLEVHLFDFDAQVYGDKVLVTFHDFVRPERKFDGLEALKVQIGQDCQTARDVLDGAGVGA